MEESAPVQDRIKYLFCIVYPAQYELKADLARRYLQCSVVSSALAYFRVRNNFKSDLVVIVLCVLGICAISIYPRIHIHIFTYIYTHIGIAIVG